jgi:cold shock CspA family protein
MELMEGCVVEGRVAEFDEERGIGWVEAGGERWFFHCTQIADGSRTVAVGTPVTFEVRPGHRGTWEAVQVAPRA